MQSCPTQSPPVPSHSWSSAPWPAAKVRPNATRHNVQPPNSKYPASRESGGGPASKGPPSPSLGPTQYSVLSTGPSDSRSTSDIGTTLQGGWGAVPAISWSSNVAAALPSSRNGPRTLARGGVSNRLGGSSSKPTIANSSGTRSPLS